MTISIIGTGNIAWFLGNRLVAAGHRCYGVYGRNDAAVKELADNLLAPHHGSVKDIEDGRADVCFLAVSDTGIKEVAAQLKLKQMALIHTAGAVAIDEIKHAAADAAVLWPVYSIARQSLPAHRHIPCAWEAGTDKAQRLVLAMGHAITDELFAAGYDQRKWMHLAAVIGNNFVNHLVDICEQVCKENDLPYSALMPIIEQTFDRLKHHSAAEVQTGPAKRGDEATIHAQLHQLQCHPLWQRVYEAITASIQQK